MNYNILPFSYRTVSNTIIDSSYLYQFKLDPLVLERLLVIQNIPTEFKPIWGIKIENNHILDIEVYFYLYNPNTGHMLYDNTITPTKLLNYFPEYDKPFVSLYPMTMFSIDLMQKSNFINYYYATKINDDLDEGFNTYQFRLENMYYRYHSAYILSHNRFIDKNLLTQYYNHKTFFVADKKYKGFIGCYYDGISQDQFNYFINKYQIRNIPLLDKDQYCSIHIDYDCYDKTPIKYGIYGLLN
jgi:hypothetical protein